MELYVVAGGEQNSIKRWADDLSAQFLPTYTDGKKTILGKDDKGRDVYEYRRLLIAPVQLYKIAFAKEELKNVLPLVCPTDYVEERYGAIKHAIKLLRKILKLKEAPKPTHENPFLQPNQVDKAVFVIPIGLKEDGIDKEKRELI